MSIFVAVDFETANPHRASACAIGLVRMEHQTITQTEYTLLKPPTELGYFTFSALHHITRQHVKESPNFSNFFIKTILKMCADADAFVAHNAAFDQNVMRACCEYYDLPMPEQPWICTVKLTRKTWPEWPSHRLDAVCGHLQIPLQHHHALADAHACAQTLVYTQQHWQKQGMSIALPDMMQILAAKKRNTKKKTL